MSAILDALIKPVVIPINARKIQFPLKCARLIACQVFKQELTGGKLWDGWRQRIRDFTAVTKGTQIKRQHGVKDWNVRRRISFGCHIHDDEFFHQFRMPQGKFHGGFAAHRVSDQVSTGKAMRLHELAQILRHDLIIENITVW